MLIRTSSVRSPRFDVWRRLPCLGWTRGHRTTPGVVFLSISSMMHTGGYTCATAEAAGVKFELTTLAKMGRFDQEVSIDMPAASDIPRLETITVKPVCMGFEDFYAGWSPETPPGFSVSPIQGRMERRGGEPSLFDIEVKADGQTGEKVGYLCIVLPDDDEQFTIKVTVNCF